ncbi:ABC transporter ATPase [Bacteroidales bacterium]|nr:ABC transporter ATPase [Bacteroidales bacterium]
METILKIEGLSKNYGALQALNNVSFEIKKGNVYGILGPNGSGKSTTLGIVLNVVNKTAGSYTWFRGSVQNQEVQKKVGAIIEKPNFYPYLSAYQNLQLVCDIKRVEYSKIDQNLKLVGLLERKTSKFSTFSLGMKQRLAIASALLNDPEILILDEPTNGLDPQGILEIRNIIKSITARGMTILLASHLLDEVEKVCSHVVILRKGQVIYCGAVDGIANGEGFFELQAQDEALLISVLAQHPSIDKISGQDGKVIASLKAPLETAELNRFLFEHGLSVNHLVKRKESLEEQFIKLVANK